MKRIVLALVALVIFSIPAAAGIDEAINSATKPIAEIIGQIVFFKIPVFGAQLPVVVLWLVIGAVFFTIYTGFINIRGFGHAIELVRGDYANPKDAG
ncbi:MAG: alanine glycine permease, partial [Hyphomicrobiaceae bacterium]